MTHNTGLAVLAILEDGRFLDAILLAQSLTEQQIGGSTRSSSLFILELQHLFAALG
jgi:hypothetical protein